MHNNDRAVAGNEILQSWAPPIVQYYVYYYVMMAWCWTLTLVSHSELQILLDKSSHITTTTTSPTILGKSICVIRIIMDALLRPGLLKSSRPLARIHLVTPNTKFTIGDRSTTCFSVICLLKVHEWQRLAVPGSASLLREKWFRGD